MAKLKWDLILNKKRIKDYKTSKKSFDVRDEFENDYDRILFSASFIRLQDKAQVLVIDFICGMTDSYAAHIYQEMMGIKL